MIRLLFILFFGLVYITGCIVTGRAVKKVDSFNNTIRVFTVVFWPLVSVVFFFVSIGGLLFDLVSSEEISKKKKK